MSRKQTQISVGIYPEQEKMLDYLLKESGDLRSHLLRTAIRLGLEQMVVMHDRAKKRLEDS